MLARALTRVSCEVEIELHVAMGEHLVPGGLIAEIRGDDLLERGLLREAVLDAITLGRMRDIDGIGRTRRGLLIQPIDHAHRDLTQRATPSS